MAVQIPVLCPRCETVLNLFDQSKLGSWVKCASCEQVFVAQSAVPLESITAQTRAEPAPPSRPPVRQTELTSIDNTEDDFSESEFADDSSDDDTDLTSSAPSRVKATSGAKSSKANLRVKTGTAKKAKGKGAKGKNTGSASMIPLVLAVIGLSIVVVVQLVVIIVLVSTGPDSRKSTSPTNVAPPVSNVPVSPAPTPPKPATPANVDVGRE